MKSNPYKAPALSNTVSISTFCDPTNRSAFPVTGKVLVCLIGLGLFAANPWRDLLFYEDIAAHEGFGTIADAYMIGVAGQLSATIMLLPVAAFLIVFGIGRSNRFSIRPRFDLFTWRWGVIASIASILMVLIESDYVIYGLNYEHHADTVLISLSYIAFIYVWWCCSLAHAKN